MYEPFNLNEIYWEIVALQILGKESSSSAQLSRHSCGPDLGSGGHYVPDLRSWGHFCDFGKGRINELCCLLTQRNRCIFLCLKSDSVRYTAFLEFYDIHRQPLFINHTVSFNIDLHLEYTEDGQSPESQAPCLEVRFFAVRLHLLPPCISYFPAFFLYFLLYLDACLLGTGIRRGWVVASTLAS